MASNQMNLEKKVSNIFTEMFSYSNIDKIKKSSMKNESEWDSLKHMEIIFTIEKSFKIKLKQSDIIKMTSFKSILNILKKY